MMIMMIMTRFERLEQNVQDFVSDPLGQITKDLGLSQVGLKYE